MWTYIIGTGLIFWASSLYACGNMYAKAHNSDDLRWHARWLAAAIVFGWCLPIIAGFYLMAVILGIAGKEIPKGIKSLISDMDLPEVKLPKLRASRQVSPGQLSITESKGGEVSISK